MFKNELGERLKILERSNSDYIFQTNRIATMRDFNQNKDTYSRCQFVSAERFELSTNGLKGRCSAVELRAQHKADCILTREIFIVNVRP
jgi:hypothetical protein